jgi:hypothetical protein
MVAAPSRSRALLLAALAVCATLAACSSRDSRTSIQTSVDSLTASRLHVTDTANPFRSTGQHTLGPPTGKIRVANLLEIHGQPSGPVDIYDVHRLDSTSTPIIKHLAFGQMSDYVSPRAGSAGSRSNLYLYQADQKTGSEPWGTNIDQGGFEPSDQLSIALAPVDNGAPAGAIGEVFVEEGGKRLNNMVSDGETATQGSGGLLIVRAANSMIDTLPQQYIMVDGACPKPKYVGSMMLFPVAPGTHTIGLVTSPHGKVLETCAGHSPTSTLSENVAAGQRYVVWIYGLPSDGLKIMAAPIAKP